MATTSMLNRLTILLSVVLMNVSSVVAQTASLKDLLGAWYFHQHMMDSALIADADIPTAFPSRDFAMMQRSASAFPGMPLPDSATFAGTLRKNDENYRRYRLVFNSDSTYTTELAAGMAKWLPDNGRLKPQPTDGGLQMMAAYGMPVTMSMTIKESELHLQLTEPNMFGVDTPKMNRTLVFRRQEP